MGNKDLRMVTLLTFYDLRSFPFLKLGNIRTDKPSSNFMKESYVSFKD